MVDSSGMTHTTTTTTPAPRFADSPDFGIDLSGATPELRADQHRPTMRPGPGTTVPAVR